VRFKSNSYWEWGFDVLFALPVLAAIGLWFFWRLPGWAVLISAVLTLICAVAFFPYVTKFDLVEDKNGHDANKPSLPGPP
jgi:predicted MFS family arabinose efflux permease